MITQCFNNGTVKLKCGATQIIYDILRIKPYRSNTKVDDTSSKDMSDSFKI